MTIVFIQRDWIFSSFFVVFAETVNVSFGVGLVQILNVDEKAQVIKLKLYERHVS